MKGTNGSAERNMSVEHKEVLTASPTTPVSELSAVMEREDVDSVVVTEQEGAPVGIVTDHDLKTCAYGPAPSKKTAGDIMSKRVLI